jgi:hypothetical protein
MTRRKLMARRSIALVMVCLAALLAMSVAAQADTTDIIEPQHEPPTAEDGFQAGTCTTDEPAPGVHCSPSTPELFYTQAGGHPPIGFTQYIIQHENGTGELGPSTGIPVPISPIKPPTLNRDIKTLRVDLPPGLTVNPNATPKCAVADFENVEGGVHKPNCGEGTIVGTEEVTLVVTVSGVIPGPTLPGPTPTTLPAGTVVPPSEATGTKVPVYNLEPEFGEPALFGFVVAGKEEVFLKTSVAWESDFHEAFTIHLDPAEPPFETLKSRLVNFGRDAGNLGPTPEGDGTYINNPTTCFSPTEWPHLYSTWFRAESYGEPNPNFPFGSTPVEAKVEDDEGHLIQQEGCDKVPFDPGVQVDPGTNLIDSPAPATVDTTLRFYRGDESEVQESHLKRAEVTLPQGMGLNPAAADNLVACTDGQFKKGQRVYDNQCPAGSKIGTAEIETPPLPAGSLKGDIYVGEQKSRNPASGELFRILVEAKTEERGVAVRLVGNVKPDAKTGQLTAVFDEQEVGELAGKLPQGLPQVPFTSVKLHFDGTKGVLSSPPTCAAATTTGNMTPWARPGEVVKITSKPFTLSTDPSGGSCPQTLAQRKFAPYYAAVSQSSSAGAYSPFRAIISRSDGQQEIKGVNVTLPKGLTAKLAGIPYCSETAIANAEQRSGMAEQKESSCPDKSQVGVSSTSSGTGPHPIHLNGTVYLAGPYKGAPISLVNVTPAVTGPFDLGNVVVRVAAYVDVETGQVNAVSDPIPDVYGGVKLDVRSIDLNMDKFRFMLNPTHCGRTQTEGTILGGGADPTNPAAFSSFPVSYMYQPIGCKKLKFKPKLNVRLSGPTKRAGNPKLRAVLTARHGDANIARTALTLPHSLFLDQSHIGKVCTRPQLASHTCPKASVYGSAYATTPLLDKKLKGKVYLVPSKHELPDLLVDLRGQVEIHLRGVISSKHGGLKTVFPRVPDLPVKKFVLNMKGGTKSLLTTSVPNLCRKPQRAVLNIKGQNSRRVKNNRFKLNIAGCGKHKKHQKGNT